MRALAPIAVALGVGLLLTGCAGPSLRDDVEHIESDLTATLDEVPGVEEARVTWYSRFIVVDLKLDPGNSCASRAATAVAVSDAYAESDHSYLSPQLNVASGESVFSWVNYEPDFADRYAAATMIWCSHLDDALASRAGVSTTNFVRGEEFGISLRAADDAAAAVLTAEVTAAAAEAGLLVRPGGINVMVRD